MNASGGVRSGLGVMLVISLIGAAIVAPRRLSYLYAALATIALLLEQAYWVLGHDAPVNSFVQPGLLAIGGFVDRKSTRLNSSHVKISYAVFCLKKKR